MPALDRDEYVEQAYLFGTLRERADQGVSTQELLKSIKDEILATTKLPMAIDFLAAELRANGIIGPAMTRLAHYFAPFQAFMVERSEDERSKFDFQVALAALEAEARYRSQGATATGLFFFQFEMICRNRLGYDAGLKAMAADPLYDETWRGWIHQLRRELGIVELADVVYVSSRHYERRAEARGTADEDRKRPVIFDEKEGKIALANRRKDPLWLFAALQRHLGYPSVPRPKPVDDTRGNLLQLAKRLERVEARLKLLEEEEAKGAVDLTKLYEKGVKFHNDIE